MTNIKQFVRSILSDAEILNLLPDKKVYFLHAINPDKKMYVEYEIYDENGEAWSEGTEIATNYYIQVDIFSIGDYTELENKIKEKMINAGFERSMCADLWESDIQLHHKAMRFLIAL